MKRIWVALALAACACGGSGTGGREVGFALGAESVPRGDAAPGRFTNRLGWDVSLEEARIAVGPIYLLTNPPPSARNFRLLDWIAPRAYAHSGFDDFDGGEVKGELLTQFVFDALHAGVQPIADLRGIAGPVRAVNLGLEPPKPGTDGLHGHHAWVVGTATRGEETVRFRGGLDLPEGTFRKVVGIPADVELDDGSLVVLELHLERWFDEADFSTLGPADAEGVRTIAPDGQVRGAWFIGARGYGTFSIR
ncbi:hypothetical protein [Vulgatibacter incomptus]|uniref:Putative lipoprotein n=1 Tax=Vulgatibacter incomptus TaxID=1391653 RepID=A0A0K1PF45_9BACT|nr:hypothetical protein [Vulgatibacter incomptus]AKU92046.1 putative lipoprotein [Vulgatibacter incomptus]